MSEMEDLKRNTEIEKQKQTRDDLVSYLHELDIEILDRMRWHMRARNLEFIVLLIHFGSMMILALQGALYSDFGWISDISFTLWLITALRSSVIHTQQIGAMREQVGIFKTLKILGMLKDDDHTPRKRVKVKKWNPFSRYQEFWERVTEGKSEEKFA